METEKRFFEIRSDSAGEKPKLIGYAAKFDTLSENLGGFVEKIARGAFQKTLEKDDIRALFDHDSRFVLGRNRAKTLFLEEDETGLRVEITPPESRWADDLLKSVERGDINQMSFGFLTRSDRWDGLSGTETPIRTLLEVDLLDVSIVAYPAYPDTSIALRSLGRLRDWKPAVSARSRYVNILKMEN